MPPHRIIIEVKNGIVTLISTTYPAKRCPVITIVDHDTGESGPACIDYDCTDSNLNNLLE